MQQLSACPRTDLFTTLSEVGQRKDLQKLRFFKLLASFLLLSQRSSNFQLVNRNLETCRHGSLGRRSQTEMGGFSTQGLGLFWTSAVSSVLIVDALRRFQRCTPKWMMGCDAEDAASTIRELYGDAAYWPTPWLAGVLSGHLQTIWYGLNPSPPAFGFEEDLWETSDGGTLGLAWPATPDSLVQSVPIVLILPGLCGSVKNTGHAVRAMIAVDLRPVVLHARGCGQQLTSPRFNLFGCTDDLREAIRRASMKYPDSPLCLYSISASTALMVRYLGEEGPRAPVVAAVANCPGYDIGVCLQRVSNIYDKGFYINVLKRHWLSGRNGDILRRSSPELFKLLEQAPDMHSFVVAASPFAFPLEEKSGFGPAIVAKAFPQLLANSNPMCVAHQMQVPSLIVNADDDPVCSRVNTDENGAELVSGSNCRKTVLLRYPVGGHCCFARGLRAERWVDQLAAGFLSAMAKSSS